jgi:hypothetical protein
MGIKEYKEARDRFVFEEEDNSEDSDEEAEETEEDEDKEDANNMSMFKR